MARDTDSIFNDVDIFALTGDKSQPSFNLNSGWGSIYSTTEAPSRETFNYLYYRLTLLAQQVNAYGGALLWDTSIPYKKGAIVTGSDGLNYYAKSDNSAVDPVTDASNTTWGYDDTSTLDAINAYRDTGGQVKIDSYAGVAETKPSVTVVTTADNTLSAWFDLEYGADLNFSTVTEWPIMDPNKNDASIWDNSNKLFRENNSVNQSHLWRIILDYSRASFEKVQVVIRLFNPTTNFESTYLTYFSEERRSSPDVGKETILLSTVADSDSLSTNMGYKLQIAAYGDNGASIDFTLDSITRISSPNANQNTI